MSEYERLRQLAQSDPEQFRTLIQAVSTRVVNPHAGQQQVIDSQARFRVVNAGRRWGKFHSADTPVLTPQGWVPIGGLGPGNEVIGSDGAPCTVTNVYPQGVQPLASVHFKDGTFVSAGYEHLWSVRRRWRKGRKNLSEVLTTQEIIDEGVCFPRPDGRVERRFAVAAIAPVQHPYKRLPLPPYTLGALLGDGSLGHSTPILWSADPQIPEELTKEGADIRKVSLSSASSCLAYTVCGIVNTIRELGLNTRSEHKKVPTSYFTSSINQRLALLQGLMDTDGWLESPRRAAFASASKDLTLAVRTLALSLGGKVTPIQQKATTHLDSFVIRFYMPEGVCPFRLLRKATKWSPTPPERLARQIVKIEPRAPADAVCISVDSPDGLYAVSGYVLTHNTMLAAKLIVGATRKKNQFCWWVAPSYRVTKRGYAEVLRQLPDGVLAHDPPPETNFDAGRPITLRFKNGSRMEFFSGERPEGMLGAAVDFVVMDEAATMGARIFNQIVSPTLIDRLGKAFLISTPRGRNWLYTAYQKGQDPQQPDWASWTFSTEDNPTLPEGEARRMSADMPRLEADQEIWAKFLAAGSSTFHLAPKAIQQDRILENGMIEDQPPAGYVVLGIDLARTNDYTVLYGCRMRDRRNCYFERMQAITWPEQKRRIRRAVRQLKAAGAEHVMLVMDQTGGSVGDPIVEDLESEGYDVVGINFTTHKTSMVRLLAKDLEEARAFILSDAEMTEFENYTMALTGTGKMTYSAPEGQHDDVVSAKMLAHWGVVNEGFGEVTVLNEAAVAAGPTDDPFADSDEDDAWDDLLDEAAGGDLSDEEAAAAAGFEDPRVPTTQELMNRPDLWF